MNQGIYLNQALNTLSLLRPEQIELRPGRILQGTIMKLLPDQRATVQFGGLLITARLEAALVEGQKVWLQVQSETNPITLRLIPKPETASAPSNQPAGPSLVELAKAVQVPLTKEQLSFLQTLVEQKVPLSTDLLQKLPELIKQFGATPELAHTLEVIGNKELPLTNETILAVRAFQKNESYTQQIDHILQQITEYSKNSKLAADNHSVASDSLHARVNQLTEQLLKSKEIIYTLDQKLNELLDSNTSQSSSKQMKTDSSTEKTSIPEQPQMKESMVSPNFLKSENSFLSHQAVDNMEAKQLISGLFQQLGLQHEHQVLQQTASDHLETNQHLGNVKAAILQLLQNPEADHLPHLFRPEPAASDHPNTHQHLGNVKAAILQLLQSPEADHLPQLLRQDLIHLKDHITGQQLILTENNTTTAFVQFSLQIPLLGMHHDQNAFIHIESRKKGNKTIDKENCRLFFYLTMQHLGETIVDVSIINKILSITLYNDQMWILDLVQQLRGDLEKYMLGHGYILSNFKIASLPENVLSFIQSPPDSMINYKGVDIRI